MYSRILVATDGSELADKGVEAGLALARALAARVVLVTASEPWQDIYPGDPNGMALSSELRDDYRKSKQADCERILAQAQTRAKALGIDAVETHDCFAMTEYMAIDHLGLTAPGESWKAVEAGDIEIGGRLPINPSGGLIGLGHPVGATGVRMMLDATKQVTGKAGDYQVEGARNFATFNVGGSATTSVSFVVGV